jgi:hypothetical protein
LIVFPEKVNILKVYGLQRDLRISYTPDAEDAIVDTGAGGYSREEA